MTEVILIGRPPNPADDAADRLVDGVVMALSEFDTDTLLAIADLQHEINPDGWIHRMIVSYVEVWR